MIRHDEVIRIGRAQKPHGLKGELSVETDCDYDFPADSCVVMEIDGILVPFFVESSRPKNADCTLLTLDGITDDRTAARLSLKDIFILRDDAEKAGLIDDADSDILYLSDMPGYMIIDTEGKVIGTIRRIDDTTINTLLEVETPAGQKILLPFSEDFVADVDPVNKSMMLDLPAGILDLNQ